MTFQRVLTRRTNQIQEKEPWSLDCGHKCCTKCLNDWMAFLVETGDHSKLKCPALKCTKMIMVDDVKHVLINPAHVLFVRDANKMSALVKIICPNKRCENEIRYSSKRMASSKEPQLKCKKCKKLICFSCHCTWHKNKTCQEFLKTAQSDEVFAIAARKMGCKKCPKCGVFTKKIAGCDAMYCTLCRSAWGWSTSVIQS